MSELPEGWVESPLLDIIKLHDSKRIPLNSKQRAERHGPYPYYGANGQVDTIDEYIFDGDYILLAEDGGYFENPERGVAYEVSGKFWVNNHAHIIEVTSDIPRRFMAHALNALDWMPFVGGSTRLKLTQQGMQRVCIPLPPVPEQRRVVAKLDNLFARTKAARDEFTRIPLLIEHYKQAILEKAFNGELTADWRQERELQDAPLALVGSLVSDIRYGTSKKCFAEEHGTAVLRIPNVSGGKIILADLKYAELDEREQRKLALEVGDLLIVRSNGSPDLVGRPALVTEAERGLAYAGYLIRLRPTPSAVLSEYLKLMLDTPQIRSAIEVSARSTSGVHNINSQELASLKVPRPNLDEQAQIVKRLNAAMEWLNLVATEQGKAVQLLDHLDQGLLAKAFRGELVPQDPNDEPAEKLLERIRSARAAQPKPRRGRRRGVAATC